MKDKIKCHTEGQYPFPHRTEGDTVELAKLWADLDKAIGAAWLASEMEDEREKLKQSLRYTVRFRERRW